MQLNFDYLLISYNIIFRLIVVSIVLTIRRIVRGKWFQKHKRFLTSPFMALAYVVLAHVAIIFLCLGVVYVLFLLMAYSSSEDRPASSIDFHTNEDLKRITGVEFPEVIPVDSTYHSEFNGYETNIKFVPVKPLDKTFFRSLDKACQQDSCCWRKDSLNYIYHIFPETPVDRPNGTHISQVEVKGNLINAWQGYFISVSIPFSGDTIYVSDGSYQ